MLEVETKIRVGEVEAVRRRLAALGAGLEPARVQTDLFFQHPQRDFAATDEALRLRSEEGVLELTYKGPRHESDAKVRDEVNVPVAADPTPLLEALGFRKAAVLRKERASTRVDECRVELDHVAGLGWFLEVEALGDDAPAAAAAVHTTLARLGLEDAPRITDSYLEMALSAGAEGARTV